MHATLKTTSFPLLARRLAVYVMDSFALLGAVLATQGMLYALNLNPLIRLINAGPSPTGAQVHLWVFATVSVPFWLYYAAWHSSRWQATPGKRLLGLRVTTLAGGRLSFGRALVRAVVMLIPFEVNHVVLFHLAPQTATPSPAFRAGLALVWALIALYALTPLLNARRQSVHDIVAGTMVHSTPSPVSNL